MTNSLREAVAKAENLPLAAQEKIGDELLLHIEKLNRLRRKLQRGISSLDRGEGQEVNIETVIKRARARYDKEK